MRRTLYVLGGLALASLFAAGVSPKAALVPTAEAAGGFTIQDAWPGVTFQTPVDVAAPADGSDRLFVVERAGRILVGKKFRGGAAVPPPSVFLDIRSLQMQGEALDQGHGGLVAVAFPPNFAQTQTFAVFYGTGAGTDTDPYRAVVASYRTSAGNPNVADPASGRVLLEVRKRAPIHFGGGLTFDKKGMLCIGIGDSGTKNDPDKLGQDTRVLEAKILRIDIGATSPGLPYGIPQDNPWATGAGGVRPEIWAYGVRNPYRMSCDRETGDLWIGDPGQQRREDVSMVPRAGNLGWPLMEADQPLVAGDASSCVPPVFAYGREMGRCVIGGVVYRGQRCPDLVGKYLFGDNMAPQASDADKSGRLWAIPVKGGRSTGAPEAVVDVEDVVSIDQDADGEVYFSQLSTGRVTTLVPAR